MHENHDDAEEFFWCSWDDVLSLLKVPANGPTMAGKYSVRFEMCCALETPSFQPSNTNTKDTIFHFTPCVVEQRNMDKKNASDNYREARQQVMQLSLLFFAKIVGFVNAKQPHILSKINVTFRYWLTSIFMN